MRPFPQNAHEMECDVMTMIMVKFEYSYQIFCLFVFFSVLLLLLLLCVFGYSNVMYGKKSNAELGTIEYACACVCAGAFETKIECH